MDGPSSSRDPGPVVPTSGRGTARPDGRKANGPLTNLTVIHLLLSRVLSDWYNFSYCRLGGMLFPIYLSIHKKARGNFCWRL